MEDLPSVKEAISASKKSPTHNCCCTYILYTGSGAYAGGSIGSILGSAIGGLSGGPRGSDMGTIIGMAGGAVVGAVIGSQADQAQADREAAYQQDRVERRSG